MSHNPLWKSKSKRREDEALPTHTTKYRRVSRHAPMYKDAKVELLEQKGDICRVRLLSSGDIVELPKDYFRMSW